VATNRVRDLLLRLTGDPSDAKQALRDVARDIDAFGRLKAEATVDVNTKPAEEALVGATAAVKKFDTLTATAKIDLQVAGAEAQLNRLRTRLENLSKQGASPKVDIQVAKTVAQIERVEAKLTALGRRKVDIDVDIKRGALESIGGAIRGAVGAVGGALGGGGGALFGGLSKISSAVSGLLPLLRGAAVLIGIALAPALLALAASALAAAAGVAALATAFAVAMGPVVLVAVAAFTRLAKVLEAVKENKDKVAAGAERVRDAHQREAQATENLQRAQEHARDTAVEAYRAQAQAAEDAADAVLSLEHAELSREQAQLNLVKAKDALHDFRRENDLLSSSLDGLFRKFTDVSFRPESLIKAVRGSELGGAVGGGDKSTELTQLLIDVKDAKLGIKDADDTVADSKTKLNEASAKEAEFAQNGLAAYEPYQQALEQVADAQHGVRDATEAMTTARREQQKALKELDPQERKLADVFTRLQKTLTAVFRPATDAIFKGVISFLNDLEDFAGDSKVRAGFTNIGRAIGTIFTALGREMRKREFRDGFKDFADSAARMIRALGGAGLRDFLTIMLRIARVALPAVERFVGSIADKLEDWRKGTDNSKRLHSRIEDLLKSTRRWANLLKAAFDFLSALFGPAKKSGDSLVVSMTNALKRWADWMREHPEEVKQFFRDAGELAKRLGRDLEKVVGWLDDIVGAADKAKNAIEKVAEAFGKASTKTPIPGSDTDVLGWLQRLDKVNPISLQRRLITGGIKQLFRQSGGPVPGTGTGDTVPAMLEPGEFVLRRSVAQSIGLSALSRLNATGLGGGPAGMTISEQNIILPPAPGHDQLGDPRHQAAMLARELRRRGYAGVGGGGSGA
jgi:hypothetical protein